MNSYKKTASIDAVLIYKYVNLTSFNSSAINC